jgi:hypothetical protein
MKTFITNSSPNIVIMMQLRKMRLTEHVKCMEGECINGFGRMI